jgi:GDP-L-fucose synthase
MKKEAFKKFIISDEHKQVVNELLKEPLKIGGARIALEHIGNPPLTLPKEFLKTNENFKEFKNDALKNNGDNVYQAWYSLETQQQTSKKIENVLETIFKENYPEVTEPLNIMWEFTMFDEDCFIKEHIDGRDVNRIAGILIYLNKDYDESNGGLLKVIDPNTNEESYVIPEFGNAILIDYTQNEVSHEVTKVKKEKRLAICAFIHKINYMNKDKRVLVTGASGFIGSQLVKTLIGKHYKSIRTTSFSRDLPNSIKDLPGIEHIKGNLRDADFCEEITKDVDVIFHLAANTSNALDTKFNPLLHVTPNVEMNVNLMEQAWRNGVKKFMFISSNTTYPDMGDKFCKEDMNVHATSLLPIYKAVGGMKRYGEMLCDFFSNQIHNPMQCIILRPSNAFGPNDKFDFEKCHVTPANIRKVADGLNPIPLWGDGTEIRDLLHVEDMAEGFLHAAEKCSKYDIINICYGEGFSVNQVLEWLKEMDNNTNPVEFTNNKAPMIPVRLLSSEKINKLGWKPKRDLKQALKETLEWYKANKHLYNPNSKP